MKKKNIVIINMGKVIYHFHSPPFLEEPFSKQRNPS
jgi:hypothetical protein